MRRSHTRSRNEPLRPQQKTLPNRLARSRFRRPLQSDEILRLLDDAEDSTHLVLITVRDWWRARIRAQNQAQGIDDPVWWAGDEAPESNEVGDESRYDGEEEEAEARAVLLADIPQCAIDRVKRFVSDQIQDAEIRRIVNGIETDGI